MPLRTSLPRQAAIGHRVAHQLGQAGFRGLSVYWNRARPPSAPVVVGSGQLEVNPRDPLEAAIYRGVYERADLAIVEKLVRPGSMCVDVGANIGLYTLLLAHAVGPRGSVLALEPAPDTYRRLRDHVKGFPQIEVRPEAASDVKATARLNLWTNGSGIAALDNHGWDDASGTVDVPTVRLDDVVPNDGEIALLKIDAEGHERAVLDGARELLASERVQSMLVETNPQWDREDHVARLLTSDRYRVFRVDYVLSRTALRRVPALTPITGSLPKSQTNVLVVREDRVAAVSDFIR